MKITFPTFENHVTEVPAEELCYKLQNINKANLMRSLIYNEYENVKRNGGVEYSRSLRSFWYSLVKPALSKLGKLESITDESIGKWDAELSRYMASMVREGYFTYDDLGIHDTSRKKRQPIKYTNSLNISSDWVRPDFYPNILICTEKDTVYSIIESVSSYFGLSCISGKGQNSFGAMEDIVRNFRKDQPITIITLTDYDPAGYSISDTFFNQITDLLPVLKMNNKVELLRVGIHLSQLTESEIELNKYVPKGDVEKWLSLTNGINGEFYGLELDAMSPIKIRSIFVEAIKPLINTEQYKELLEQERLKSYVLEFFEKKLAQALGVNKKSIDKEIVDKLAGCSYARVDFDDFLFQNAKSNKDHLKSANFTDLDIDRIDFELGKIFKQVL